MAMMTSNRHNPVLFIDLKAQRRRLGRRIEQAIMKVVDRGEFILGSEIAELEQRLAAIVGARACITCASGTDALMLILTARGVGPGDGVLVPAFAYPSVAETVVLLGATPIFVDVLPDTFTLDPAGIAAGVAAARAARVAPRGVIAVDLFGHPADYRRILPAARAHELFVVCEGAHGFGATLDGARVGTFGDATAISFFPTMPLGAYGDGGAVFTDDPIIERLIRGLLAPESGVERAEHAQYDKAGRLDTLQAAVLLEKLSIFSEELSSRLQVAERYAAALADFIAVPTVAAGATSVWSHYTIKADDRDQLLTACRAWGLATRICYPVPLNRLPPFHDCPVAGGKVPVAEELSRKVLSLPMHPYLISTEQDRVIGALRTAFFQGPFEPHYG
ncbi:UDP-2-acetamido-2-deoxy-3-oxo-D-glucuronate aminotransferase [uncultured Gammaproteobacteria bacterium]